MWKQILKYSEINKVFRLVKRQGLSAGLYPTTYGIARTMLLFLNSSTVYYLLLCCMEMVCFFTRLFFNA